MKLLVKPMKLPPSAAAMPPMARSCLYCFKDLCQLSGNLGLISTAAREQIIRDTFMRIHQDLCSAAVLLCPIQTQGKVPHPYETMCRNMVHRSLSLERQAFVIKTKQYLSEAVFDI